MDEPKTALPALLPWAATACLAAMVACMGELWVIEKARAQMLRDENLLADAALKGVQNQLEAERILDRREREEFSAARGAASGLRVTLLAKVAPASPSVPPAGAIVWDPAGDLCLLRASGLAPDSPDKDFQLWLLGPGPGYPADCGTFHALPSDDSCIQLKLPAPVAPGCGFMLLYGTKGGARTFEDAVSKGRIELASRPPPGKITN